LPERQVAGAGFRGRVNGEARSSSTSEAGSMKTVYSERHRLRNSRTELYGGQLVRPFECPERMDIILARVRERHLGEVCDGREYGLDPVLRVHDEAYVEFLATCWKEWTAAGYKGEAIATCWPSRRMTRQLPPAEIDGRIGYYCLASETSISEGTWEAALAAKDVALTAASLIGAGERSAFALCRPPGHHAATDMFGGYCFLNNAAITAQAFVDDGAGRVAILDIDFHHGNGTQQIFYQRANVFYGSIHGDPLYAFPYFLGGADETGTGPGEGCNANYPLRPESDFDLWGAALDEALAQVRGFGPETLVVSLGVDTYLGDPISFFRLRSEDFRTCGARLAALRLPTLFVMEGGYAVEQIGINTVNVLEGFEDA